ncbi:hypothetical protein ABBQ38_007518 [Trebouxia sp. C0009 RCD-2024]
MATLSNPFVMSKEQKKKKLRVGVAIDGSGVSEKALLLGGRLLHPDRCDRLYILHISDPNKPWLPDTLTPDHLEHEYQLKCHEQQLDGVWYKKEKAKGQTTCEALVELTEELQVDILVVGSFGRKGERMICKPGDKLHVVWVTTTGADDSDATLQTYKDAMHEAKVEGTCFMSGTKAGEPVADGILAVASELDVDILVMGISGYG